MSDVTTEELERLVAGRRTCGHDYLRSGCQDCDNLRAVNRSWSEFRDRVSYEELVRELLAGRKAWEEMGRLCGSEELSALEALAGVAEILDALAERSE